MSSNLVYGDVSEVIERINDVTTTLRTPAVLAWSTDPINEFDCQVPTCLVYPGQQFSTRTHDSPVCRQETSLSVVCLIVAPIADLGIVVKDIRDAIVGWQIDPYYSIMRFTHQNIPFGGTLEIKGEYIWWQDIYEAEFLQRTV